MRTGPRLVGPSPQHIGPGGLHRQGRLDDLLLPFHGAGSRGDDGTAPFADANAANVHHAPLRVKIAGDQLVRLGDMDDLLNARQVADRQIVHVPFVAEHPHRGALAAGYRRRPQTHLFDGLHDCVELFLRGLETHDDKHRHLPVTRFGYETIAR